MHVSCMPPFPRWISLSEVKRYTYIADFLWLEVKELKTTFTYSRIDRFVGSDNLISKPNPRVFINNKFHTIQFMKRELLVMSDAYVFYFGLFNCIFHNPGKHQNRWRLLQINWYIHKFSCLVNMVVQFTLRIQVRLYPTLLRRINLKQWR